MAPLQAVADIDDGQAVDALPAADYAHPQPGDRTWLKVLARTRYPTKNAFARAFERIVHEWDPTAGAPDPKTVERWMGGARTPYARHCVVLEAMFPGWSAAQLLSAPDLTPNDPMPNTEGRRARVQTCCSRCGFVIPVVIEVVPAIDGAGS